MIRRLIRLAIVLVVLALIGIGVLIWLVYVPAPPVPRLEGVLRSSRLTVQGRVRTFAFYVPPRVRPNAPLLLVLHGSMSNGKRMRAMTGYAFDVIADREGTLVAYPDGYGGHWNDCRAAGDHQARRLAIDDVAFLRALTDWFAREHAISKRDVFAVGVSNGAAMTYALALEAPDLVSGIAAFAANLPAPENQRCSPSGRPIAAMIVNGTDDPLNPHDGGEVALFGRFFRRGMVMSSFASAKYFANLAGHHGAPREDGFPDRDPSDGTHAKRFTWSGDGGPPVHLVVIERGGHAFPHPKVKSPRLLGRGCRDFSGAEAAWDFFADTMEIR